MASHAIAWLQRRQMLARTVTIKVRYDDFTTITRSHTALPTRDEARPRRRGPSACSTRPTPGTRPVRLLGVSVHNFRGDSDVDDTPDRLPFDDAMQSTRRTQWTQGTTPAAESSMTDTWDPAQYDKFQREREQPFFDLLALIRPAPGMRVVDLGCGTGKLTRTLHEQLAARETVGIDRSASMLAGARDGAPPARPALRGRHHRIVRRPERRRTGWDLIFSNAALHWVDDHERLIAAAGGGAGAVADSSPSRCRRSTTR